MNHVRIVDLLFTFRRCHNYIAANQGLQKAEAFWELLKLIFCKIEDERSDEIQFYATTQEWQSLNGQMKVRERIGKLFLVAHQYDAVQVPTEILQLLDHHLPTGPVETPETFIDNHALNRSVLLTCVLANSQRESHRDPEPLTSTQKRHIDCRSPHYQI